MLTGGVMEKQIKKIRSEIFRLALQSPDLETMHWYIALDNCFENDEFHKDGDDGISSIVWRCQVLSWKKQPVNQLLSMVDDLFTQAVYRVKSSGDILKPIIIEVI